MALTAPHVFTDTDDAHIALFNTYATCITELQQIAGTYLMRDAVTVSGTPATQSVTLVTPLSVDRRSGAIVLVNGVGVVPTRITWPVSPDLTHVTVAGSANFANGDRIEVYTLPAASLGNSAGIIRTAEVDSFSAPTFALDANTAVLPLSYPVAASRDGGIVVVLNGSVLQNSQSVLSANAQSVTVTLSAGVFFILGDWLEVRYDTET